MRFRQGDHDPAVEILAIQDVYLVSAPCQQAGDVGLRKKAAHVLGKEERTRVSEDQCAIRPFGRWLQAMAIKRASFSPSRIGSMGGRFSLLPLKGCVEPLDHKALANTFRDEVRKEVEAAYRRTDFFDQRRRSGSWAGGLAAVVIGRAA